MKRATLCMTLVLAGAMMVSSASQALAQPAAGGTKIAVVDVVMVFNSLNEKRDGDAQIEALGKDLEAQRQAMLKDLEDLKKELGSLKPDSDMAKDTMDKALKKGLEVQNFSDYMRERLTMEQRVRTAALYKRINDAIKTYANANGIQLVLAADKDDMSGAATLQELNSRISVRKVLYVDDKLEFTRDIVESMNAAYKLGSGK